MTYSLYFIEKYRMQSLSGKKNLKTELDYYKCCMQVQLILLKTEVKQCSPSEKHLPERDVKGNDDQKFSQLHFLKK